jgi:succinyl-CoA synthetase alpha subunit
MIKTSIFSVLTALVLALGAVDAQTPVIVQPADATPENSAARAPAAGTIVGDSKSMLQALQEMQTLNEATIKKQEAALALLDELQKAAEELKIFSKRG